MRIALIIIRTSTIEIVMNFKSFKSIPKILGVLVFALCFVSTAQATFIGQTVTYDLLHPGIGGAVHGTDSALITDGSVLGPIYYGDFGIATFGADSIVFSSGALGGGWAGGVYYHIFGLDLGITGVLFDAAASSLGAQGMISFNADNIWINMGGVQEDESSSFAIDVAFEQVPEPSIIALFGLGLVGIGFARRRQS
jgi:hypothetical protein